MSKPLNILVIDDSADDRDLYRRCLTKTVDPNTYHIHEAEDGEQGLTQAELLQPDCILLDYSLPGRNGVEVLKRVRAKDPFVPIVILTGQGNETVAVTAMKEGAQDYIAKSTITPEALERVVRVAIAHGAMQRRIHEQRTSLEIFTYALAHDLREPTNTVRSFADLILRRETLGEKGHTYLTHIQKAAERMQQLIDTVYLYTRLDAPEQIEKECCALEEIFHEVEENLVQLLQGKSISITTDQPLPQLLVNRIQLQQLLQNLISNAIRHGGDHVAIHLGAQEKEDHWLLSVSDSGPGIEPQYLEKIFEPFKRMSNTVERGLGLGLAISRKIIDFHGGKIWCESQPGKGANFYFTLPKNTSKPSESTATPAVAHTDIMVPHHSHLARILLVDDNEADIALNRIMLIEQTHMQCEVLVANDGQDALNKLSQAADQGNPIDLVLLDINMPVMSGFELLAQLHLNDKLGGTVVVMCSTSAYDIDKKMAFSMGASGYLTKPPQFAQLKAILEENPRFELARKDGQYALLRAA